MLTAAEEFARLMRQPRLCACCGKACQGTRCGECYGRVGRIKRILKAAGRAGMHEKEIGQHMYLESVLRGLERDGEIYETPNGWTKGIHPDRIALWKAWEAKRAAEGQESCVTNWITSAETNTNKSLDTTSTVMASSSPSGQSSP